MKTLLKLKLWYNYLRQKSEFATLLALQKRDAGQVTDELWSAAMKNMLVAKMTCFHVSKGVEMLPTIAAEETLLVRKLPHLNAKLYRNFVPRLAQDLQQMNVGDVVVLKDPLDLNNLVVRRLAAVSGYEMVSKDEEDEPFILEDGQCWVVSDNDNLKPGERKDSRTYGPVPMTNIVGRVIYRYQTMDQHGFVVNSKDSMKSDMPVLFAELDSQEMLEHNDKEGKGSQT